MRVLLLSDVNSVHTIKWAKNLAESNITVGIWSIAADNSYELAGYKNVIIHSPGGQQDRDSLVAKIKYITLLKDAKKFLSEFKPDILHAHYASSYGLVGKLLGFHPFVLSVWGSDVYLFPKTNFLFRWILKTNLASADRILSTSKKMAEETTKYTNKEIDVTPFGIDVDKFPYTLRENSETFNIGCIKSLEKIYGIKYLILAFADLVQLHSDNNMRLYIVGDGNEGDDLKALARELGIWEYCIFTGKVPNDSVPEYLRKLDVVVLPSLSESFGVAALEGSSMGKPIVASAVGGLPEVIEHNETGILVQPSDIDGLAEALRYLLLNPSERKRMGENGRKKVMQDYNIKNNTNTMINIYKKLLSYD